MTDDVSKKPAPAAASQPSDQQAPDAPTDLHGKGWLATAKRAFAEFRDDDMMTWAAALTYYAVLSLFPALIALVALLGVFGEHPATTNAVLDIVKQVGPESLVTTLEGTIEGIVSNNGGAGALLGFGLLGAIWSASGYIGAFFKASNAIYEVDEGRKFLKLRPIQLGLTVLFLFIVAFGAIVFVASGSLLQSIGDVVGLGSTAVDVWTYAKWPVLAIAVIMLFAVLYWAAPNVQQPKFRWVTPGGAIGLLTLIIASVLFSFYVANFAKYDKTYGTLALIPIGLTWLWICNLCLLFGAEFDSELERTRRIEAGMRPADAEPFLPVRDEPKDTKDGAELASEQVREGEIGANGEEGEQRAGNGRFARIEKHRTGGLVGKFRNR